MKWTKKGFNEFQKGSYGNGGQNLYTSANGTLQRIFNFDLNGDGYFDLPIANSHSMWERPPVYVYDTKDSQIPLSLPSNGSFNAIMTDLTGNGTDDLIVACQHDGVHTDTSAIIYFGSEIGLSEKYCMELRAPNSLGVAAGDFNGSGKKSLAFLSGSKTRIFYPTELGIEASIYTDLDIAGISIAAGDLDGDGYDDLYIMHQTTGHLSVYWGGPDGISPDNKTDFGTCAPIDDYRSSATTEGRKLYRWVPWRCSIIKYHGKSVIFRADENYAVFESFGKDRKPCEELRVFCTEKVETRTGDDILLLSYGPMHAVSGDLKNCGNCDIAIAVSTDFEVEKYVMVLWESENYAPEKATLVPSVAPRAISVGPLEKNGENYLFVAHCCARNELDIAAKAYKFNKDGSFTFIRDYEAHEPTDILTGKTYEDGRYQTVVINHEGEFKLGLEDVDVYLGGEDGFSPDRKISLPGCAAVDCMPIDFNDDGLPDLMVVNCAENAPSLDPGTTIYFNSENGFDKNNKLELDTFLSHGCAVGDFRHTGYLDFVFTAISDRQLTIIEGGPDGWSKPKKLTLGGFEDEIIHRTRENWEKAPEPSAEENERKRKFASPRWLFCADFNNDGWLDLFVPQIAGPHASILWGGPNGFSWDNRQDLAVDGAVTGNAADLTDNGYLDLIVSGFNCLNKTQVKETYITIYWGGPNGFSESKKTQLPAFCSNDITVNDFNGDGTLDFFTAAYHGGRSRDVDSRIFFANSDGSYNRENHQKIRTHSATGCLSGDFNGDGYIDLAVASHKTEGNHVNDSVVYWGGPDGINESRCTKLPSRGPHGMCTVDIGNIMNRTDSEFYTSEVYETQFKATRVSWVAENGKNTWVKIQFRCAETADSLYNAEWSESFENGADISALNLTGCIQYRLELGAKCACGTPRVTEITVDFE